MTDRANLSRLILQIERDLLAQSQLRVLLAAADATIVTHRAELRNLKARIARVAVARPARVRTRS
jgi:hypothetical protein